jgi:hypothetical protein
MLQAVESVKQRLLRAVRALEAAGIPYAVAGGHAVAVWIERVDECGVRNTPDVDILIRRQDFEAASTALASAGFVRKEDGPGVFLDGPDGKDRSAVHILFAGEKIRPEHSFPAPDIDESEAAETFRVVALSALIRMRLTSFRMKDQVHILDMIDIGQIDQSTVATAPPEFAPRLQELIDNPESYTGRGFCWKGSPVWINVMDSNQEATIPCNSSSPSSSGSPA